MEEKVIKIKASTKNIRLLRGSGAIEELPDKLSKFGVVYIISNDLVWKLCGERLSKVLKNNFEVFVLKDGERYKNIRSVEKIYNFLAEKKATRSSALIAFGGGVIGDLGAFVASTYHRGMKLIHIPTTLLSMVDSSIGGKTGFNLKYGKNLVGTFYQPEYIIVDIDFLSTLSDSEFLSGFSEVIKAALISNKKLFKLIEENKERILKREKNILGLIVSESEDIKIKVVIKDERESGIRAILNFGHTFGHSIEKLSNWKISHGFAVAKGMAFETYLSYLKGYIDLETSKRIIRVINNYSFPLKSTFSTKDIEDTVIYDKKRKDKFVEWVLLKGIGKASFGEFVESKMLKEAVNSYNDFLKDCLRR